MQADPLQQLRDIHIPAEPVWWPPAPGWWIVAGIILIAIWGFFKAWRASQQRKAPLKQAQKLYQQLHADYLEGQLSANDYVHGTNALLKRLLIHTQDVSQASNSTDADWLILLDSIADTTDFTQGPGQALGNNRFAANLNIDEAAFDPLIRRFIWGLSA